MALQQVASVSAETTKKGRTAIPDGETASERFIRLGDLRVANALDKIRLIGNLGGPQYARTESQVKAIEQALGIACNEAMMSLRKQKIATQCFKMPKA